MNKSEKLLKNTMILSLCAFINKGLLIIMIPLFSRWLSVEDYGTYDVLATYVSILLPIVTLASSNAIFRLSVDRDEIEYKKKYISNGMFIYMTNFIIIVIVIILFSKMTGWIYACPFVLLFAGQLMDNYCQGVLRALKKLEIYGIGNTFTVFLTILLVTLFVKFMNLGLKGMILGYACGFWGGALFIFFYVKLWRYIDFKKLSIEIIKELIKYSLPLIPNEISWWIINVSDRSIINYFLGAAANGVYAISYKVPNLCTSVFGVFNISWQESASEAVDEKERAYYFNTIYQKIMTILISVCIGVLSCNFLFFDYIFDSRYINARKITPILVSAVMFSLIAQFYGGIQISLKRPKANGISTVIGAIVNLIIHLGLVSFIGLYASALSTLASNVVIALIRRNMLKAEFKFILNRTHYFLIGLYFYFIIVSVKKISVLFSVLNLLCAVIIFCYVNRKLINKVFCALKNKIKHV